MRWTLQDAADYWSNSKAPKPLIAIILAVRRVFNFDQERSNRLARFIKVVNAYKLGMPVDKIQEQFGCSKFTVLRYARLAGLSKRERGFDPKIKSSTIEMYRDGKSLDEIQALLGVSKAYISKTAVEAGINRRNFKKRKRSRE